jgi:PAS domain S-box-containing protein
MGHRNYTQYDDSPDGIVFIKRNGYVKYRNKRALELIGDRPNILESLPGIDLKAISQVIDNEDTALDVTIIDNVIVIKETTEYGEFFNTSNSFACITKSDGRFVKFNDYMEKSLGTEDLYSKKFLNFVHNEDMQNVYNKLSILSKNNDKCNVSCRYLTNRGYLYLNWEIKYTDRNNLLYVSNDITELLDTKAELETSKIFLNITEDIIISGVWDWDIETGILTWSEGLKNIYEIEEVTYEKYLNQNHKDDIDTIQNTINKCLIDGKPYTITHRVIGAKTGKIKYLKARGSIIRNFNKRRLVGVGQDITEVVMNEKTLIDLRDKAIKNDDIKSTFIANVSHELRTPLNGIIGITELLKSSSGLSSKQQEYIDTLDNSCGILLSIINNVLDFSKLEKEEAHVEMSRVCIRDFINNNTKLFRFNIERKKLFFNLVIDANVPEFIDLDEIKIKQVIYNLLSNAFKFTSKGGITLHVLVKKYNLIIEIIDTGIGIEEEKQKNIFEPFNQADPSTTRKYGGTGLGLSICRAYVTLLKGSITFSSKFNVGSVFTVCIPISSDYRNKKDSPCIYIVEDNISNQYILKEIIYDFYSEICIECFENGKECVDNIEISNQPMVIFMDLHMPIMDGYMCTNILRSTGIKCPIIGVTANHMSNEKLKCMKTGMNDFLLKPINKKDIHDILNKYKTAQANATDP